MAGDLPKDTNILLDSPGEVEFATKQFWRENIDNNDFLKIYKRQGIGTRVIRKEIELMFKNGWDSPDEIAKTIAEEFQFDKYVEYAYKNALISGISLIYVNYGDDGEYSDEAPTNVKAFGYYVIPKAWIERDIYEDQTIYENYRIYRADGSIFELNPSRVIRVQANRDEMSKLLPAVNSLDVLDNVMWGVGQTMFRSGSGFPILKILNSNKIVNYKNEQVTKMEFYRKIGFLRDMNTQTGFMYDAEDEFKFEGAEGKAIAPLDYYNIALQESAIDLEVPIDILKGVSAGAITGSETNLKIYYGDLSAKQNLFLTPIYQQLFETQQIATPVVMIWNPIFEMTKKEIAENLAKDAISLNNLEKFGYLTHESAVKYLASNYDFLNIEEKEINLLKNLPVFIPQQGFNISSSDATNDQETSTLPKKVQRGEVTYSKEMFKAYRDSEKNATRLLQAFNTD